MSQIEEFSDLIFEKRSTCGKIHRLCNYLDPEKDVQLVFVKSAALDWNVINAEYKGNFSLSNQSNR